MSARTDHLTQVRAQIDRHELTPPEAFSFYSKLTAAIQDTAAARLASGRVAVGLSYEHVNNLQRTAELLEQMRGTINGALRAA